MDDHRIARAIRRFQISISVLLKQKVTARAQPSRWSRLDPNREVDNRSVVQYSIPLNLRGHGWKEMNLNQCYSARLGKAATARTPFGKWV